MRVTIPGFYPSPSATPGHVGVLCRVETDAGPVEGFALINEAELDAYVERRAIDVLRAFTSRKRLYDLGALADDSALRVYLGLPAVKS